MSRSLSLVGLAALIVAPLIAFAPPAQAQIGNIFSDPPPRPPGTVPRGAQPPADDEEEEVPDLPPQGRVLPAPGRAMQGSAMPGPVQSQPLPPPPGSTVIPQNPPPGAQQPAEPNTGIANAPAATNPLPGLPPGQRQPRGTPPANPPPAPATLQPGDEIVTEPPAQKIVNKKASFAGLDKITGRTINFDADIGETVQFGALRVKTDACYTRPSTEAANTDAFVEVDEITLQGEVKRIFSGWMFAASPGLHAVEHPIYDIWLTDCKDPETSNVASAQPDAPKPAAPPPQQRRRQQQQSQQTLPPPSSLQQPAPQPQRPQRPPPPPFPGFQQ